MINDIDNSQVKKRLIELKLKHNLKNEDISVKANVAPGTVNDHFNKSKPAKDIKIDILYKYSRLFNVTVDYLLTGEDINIKPPTETADKITPERIFEAIKTLMFAYGENSFYWDNIDNGEYDLSRYAFGFKDSILIEYCQELKKIIKTKDVLDDIGMFEIAVDKIVQRKFPGELVFENGKILFNGFDLPF